MLPDESVPQPDVVVMLNAHRETLQDAYILGTPDLVVEVRSRSTATYVRRAKMDLNVRAAFPEYWIADPYAQTVACFFLEGDAYTPAGVCNGGATLPYRVIPDLSATVQQMFA